MCLPKLGKAFEREESKEQSESEVMIAEAGGSYLIGKAAVAARARWPYVDQSGNHEQKRLLTRITKGRKVME